MRSLLLKVLPKLDNIDIAPRQAGDQSHGMQMPRIDAAGSWRSADVTSGPRKGKEKAAPSRSASKARSWSLSSHTKTSSEEIAPLERKRRLVHSDGSVINGLPLPWQQDPKKATAPQSIPKAMVAIVLGGSGTGGSTTIVKEATAVAAVMAAKKAKEAAVANEVVAVKKATEAVIEEAAVAKVAVVAKAAVVPVANTVAEEAVAVTATAEEVTTKMVAEEVVVATVTTYTAAMARLDDCGGGGPDTVRKDAKGAPYMTLDLKAVGKRTATMIELVGTSPPSLASTFTAPDGMPRIHCNFFLFSSRSFARPF
jgi:hypothetical protein